MSLYVTPVQIKQELDITAEKYDQQLYGICQAVTRLIETTTNQSYVPTLRSVKMPPGGIWLFSPLLEVLSVVNDEDEDVEYSVEGYPIHYVEVREEATLRGLWGYHSSYFQDGWLDSLDSISYISETDSEAEVSDVEGVTILGFAPRFQQGQLIKVDEEYLNVLALAVAEQTLRVARGQNGTEPIQHADSKIYVWNVEPLVKRAALIQAIRLFKRGQQAYQDASASIELGQLIYTRKLDPDVAFMLSGLREPVFA
jgi:hypothetical protein